MFPRVTRLTSVVVRFPRVRGDVPHFFCFFGGFYRFSPRARGCSSSRCSAVLPSRVFPACAGMFRSLWFELGDPIGFPRVRGDVPCVPSLSNPIVVFTPRARGCSVLSDLQQDGQYVFPACAGMFPWAIVENGPIKRFPRVRGDVPTAVSDALKSGQFSPRARGCSFQVAGASNQEPVFPACAGMFLLILFQQ